MIGSRRKDTFDILPAARQQFCRIAAIFFAKKELHPLNGQSSFFFFNCFYFRLRPPLFLLRLGLPEGAPRRVRTPSLPFRGGSSA